MKLRCIILAVLVGCGVFVSYAGVAFAEEYQAAPVDHADEYFPPNPCDGL
jgi:hypothetical protein